MTIGSVGIGIGVIYNVVTGGIARFTSGFTGLLNCGNLLTYKLDVGNNGNTVYGASIGAGYGNLNGAKIAGLDIYRLSVDSVLKVPALGMVDGTQQIPGVIEITLNFQSYGVITLDWDGTNNIYTKNGGAEATAFSDYIISLNGQRTSYDVQESLDNAYDATPANFDGNVNLSRVIVGGGETNESTLSMFVRFDSAGVPAKVYDIGDSADNTNAETTRLRINGSDILRAIFSNYDGANWNQVASVDSLAAITPGVFHHFLMTFKNSLVDGVGTQHMELMIDKVSQGTSTSFFPSNDTTLSFLNGDTIFIGSRYDGTQALVGAIADLWTTGTHFDAATSINKFVSEATSATFPNGMPVDHGGNGAIDGVVPSNYLGGKGYGLTEWNAGVNKGTSPDYTKTGSVIT